MQVIDGVQAALSPLQSSDIRIHVTHVCRWFRLCSMKVTYFFVLWVLRLAVFNAALALKRPSFKTGRLWFLESLSIKLAPT